MKLLPKTLKNPRGFTLVELMVVVAIIAILAVIGIVIFTNAQKSSRDARRRGDIEAISKALEVHINNTVNQNCTAAAGSYCPVLATWFASGAIPLDPSSGLSYTNVPTVAGTTYNVCATLEAVGTFCQANQQ